MVILRDSPTTTGRLSGPSNSFLSFSQTSNDGWYLLLIRMSTVSGTIAPASFGDSGASGGDGVAASTGTPASASAVFGSVTCPDPEPEPEPIATTCDPDPEPEPEPLSCLPPERAANAAMPPPTSTTATIARMSPVLLF